MKTLLLLLVSLALAVLRIAGLKHGAFQAFAHLWVGGLVGAWLVGRSPECLWLVVWLSVVELACFLFGGGSPPTVWPGV